MKYFLVLVSILAIASFAFANDVCKDLGYGVGYTTTATLDKGDLCDPTDGSWENGVYFYGGYTAPWPSFNASFANYFDLADYSISYPAAVSQIEVAVCKVSGMASNNTVDVFLIGESGAWPDDSILYGSESASDTGWTIPTWPSLGWNAVTMAPNIHVPATFVAGIHTYWAGGTGDEDFYTGLDSNSSVDGFCYVEDAWSTSGDQGFPGIWGIRVTVEDTTPVLPTSVGEIKAGFAQ
jgi:hypothetical protein